MTLKRSGSTSIRSTRPAWRLARFERCVNRNSPTRFSEFVTESISISARVSSNTFMAWVDSQVREKIKFGHLNSQTSRLLAPAASQAGDQFARNFLGSRNIMWIKGYGRYAGVAATSELLCQRGQISVCVREIPGIRTQGNFRAHRRCAYAHGIDACWV